LRSLALATALVVAAVPIAAAQSRADRASLARWTDSLDRIATLASLSTLDHAASARPSAGDLRHALFNLRRAELRDERGEMEHAEYEDVWIATMHGDWPWAHYLAARALADEALAGWLPASTEDNKEGSESLADSVWLELRTALDGDPMLKPARHLADTLLVAGGDRLLRDDQLAIVSSELASGAPDPDAILVWGRHLRTMRRYDSAIDAFTDAMAHGGDRSRLDLELAHTYRAVHDTANAVAAYWRGLQELTPVGRELYRFDLAWIISSDSLAAFDRLADSAVVPWMQRFWDERDAGAAARPGARLAEQLRRWAFVYAHYRVRSPWRRSMHSRIDMFYDNDDCQHFDASLYADVWKIPPIHAEDIRSHEWLIDQRGLLYLRHGEPLMRVGDAVHRFGGEDFLSGAAATVPDPTDVWSAWARGARVRTFMPQPPGSSGGVPHQMNTGPTESWVYAIDGDARLLTFRPSVSIGTYDATTLTSYLPYSPGAWFARLGTLDVYTDAAKRITKELRITGPQSLLDPPTCWNEVRAANDRSRADAAVATHNDSDSPPFVHPWAVTIGMYALGDSADQSGEALLTFALGGPALHADMLADGTASYRIAFHLTAWDAISGRSVTYDTTRTLRRRTPLGGDQLLVSWLEVPLPPGNWEIGVRAQQGDSSGGYVMRRNVAIGAGNRLAMSDIVTGRIGEPEWKATDGFPFPIETTGRWQEGSAAELFFEVHGVPSGQSYQTTLEVRTADSTSRHPLAPTIINTTDLSNGAVTFVRKSLGLEHLAAGSYLITVTLHWNGEQVSRSQRIVIRAAPAGATASQ
jgi:hypothetical protein